VDVVSDAVPPGASLSVLLRLSVETLAMSFVATTVACAGGVVAAFGATSAGRGAARRAAAHSLRALLLLCRAIPPPVWALLFLFVLFPGPLPGALSLAVYNFGVLGRLMAEVVDNHDRRAASALRAHGAARTPTFLYGVLPLVLPRFLAYGLYRWEVTVRETVVVGLVGAGGLGRLLSEQLAGFDYGGALATALALIALTYLVDLISASVRRSFR
jgi:phosphonate transport system permease protein